MTIGTPGQVVVRDVTSVRTLVARIDVRSLAVPVALFLLACAIRLMVARLLVFPTTEDGMYYEHVAQRLVEGQGLSSLALWSYSTPPLVLPRPAFEIWMPGATFLSVPFMASLGPTHAAAQVGSITLGSLVAPIAWWLGRDAALSLRLAPDRVLAIAVGSGLVAAVLGPFVVAAADPDSMTVFLVTGACAAILMQRSLTAPGLKNGLALGVALSLAYLSRQEAIWLGATYLIMLGLAARSWPGSRPRATAARLAPVVAGGLLVIGPWLVRQWLAFGTPFPGQALENALHIRGEDIFAWADRPSLERFLAQGLDAILAQRITALGYQLQGLLAVAFPVGLLGLAGAVAISRTPALRSTGALFALFVSGCLVFMSTALLFPVATLWGTYRHSAGPLLLGCVVTSVVVVDIALRRLVSIGAGRHLAAWLAPVIVMAASLPAAVGWVTFSANKAGDLRTDMTSVADALAALPVSSTGSMAGTAASADVMSDLPILTAAVTGRRVLGLPDEPPEDVAALAARYGIRTLVVIAGRGRYPDALLGTPRHPCLAADPSRIELTHGSAWLFRLGASCAVR